MTIQEIRTFKIYTRLNTSHERTIRIQQSQHIRPDGYITQSQEAFLTNFKGRICSRQPKYKKEYNQNKYCESPIVAIRKKNIKWVEIEPTKIGCKSLKSCRLNGFCSIGKCLWLKKLTPRICHLCYFPMNIGLLPIEKFTL